MQNIITKKTISVIRNYSWSKNRLQQRKFQMSRELFPPPCALSKLDNFSHNQTLQSYFYSSTLKTNYLSHSWLKDEVHSKAAQQKLWRVWPGDQTGKTDFRSSTAPSAELLLETRGLGSAQNTVLPLQVWMPQPPSSECKFRLGFGRTVSAEGHALFPVGLLQKQKIVETVRQLWISGCLKQGQMEQVAQGNL